MLILIFFLCAQQSFQQGMWIRASCLADPDSLAKIMAVAEDMNVTDLYAQVVVSGYAYYRSGVLPRSQYLAKIAGSEYDPLQAVIAAGHKRSMRVHAWVNCYVVWSLKTPPDSARHIYYQHPEWFIRDVRGRSALDYPHPVWENWGLEGLYLDPAQPEVRRYLETVCAEICGCYPVDGVHLDFIRYPGVLWGFGEDDAAQVLRGPEADTMRWMDLTRYPRLSLFLRWLGWRIWQLNRQRETVIQSTVRGILTTVQAAARGRPCKLTAAVFCHPGLARYRFGQHWTGWREAIDYPVVMSYTPDIGFFADIFDYTYPRRPDAVFGIGLIWPDMEDEAVWEIRRVKAGTGAGICFFEYTTLDTLVDREQLKDELILKPESLTMDTSRYAELGRAFTDTVPAALRRAGEGGPAMAQAMEFAAYLLSLSLNPSRDLARLGLTQDEFVRQVIVDVSGFGVLDREWDGSASLVQYLDTLIEPPSRSVAYEFLPWTADSDSCVIRRAAAVRDLPEQGTVHQRPMDKYSRSVFSAEPGVRTIVETPEGIYVFKVLAADTGGRTVRREQVRTDLCAVYEYWTRRQRVQRWLESK